MNIFIVISIGILVLCLFWGIIFGLIRGFKKSLLRLIIVTVIAVVSFLCVGMVTDGLINATFFPGLNGMSPYEYSISLISDMELIGPIVATNSELLVALVHILFNGIIFMFLFLILRLLSLIIYWILAALFFSKKKESEGDILPGANPNPKKHRFAGALLGIAQALIIFFCFMIPFGGYINTVNEALFIDVEEGKSFNDILGETENELGISFDTQGFVDSPFYKIGGFGLNQPAFDLISSKTVDGEIITLTGEVSAIKNIVVELSDLELDDLFESDLTPLKNAVNAAFESKIIRIGAKNLVTELAANRAEYFTFGEFDETIDVMLAELENSDDIKAGLLEIIDFMISCQPVINSDGINFHLTEAQATAILDALTNSQIMKAAAPYALKIFIVPLTQNIDKNFTAEEYIVQPVIDWTAERDNLLKILTGLGSLADFTDQLGKGAIGEGAEGLNNFFAQGSVSFGTTLDAIKNSQLFNPLYGSVTRYIESDGEYNVISLFNEMSGFNGDNNEEVRESLRKLFEQDDAIKNATDDMKGPKDNINWEKFNWSKYFHDIRTMADTYNNVTKIHNLIRSDNLNIDNAQNIAGIILGMELDTTSDSINELLVNIFDSDNIGNDNQNLNLKNVDTGFEANIIISLANYNDNPGDFSPQEISELRQNIADSKFIVNILIGADYVIPAELL